MAGYHQRSATVLQIRAWARRGRLAAVIDATDTPSVPVRARDLGEDRAISLYHGRAEAELFAIAPVLFRVDLELFDWIIGDLWALPWGFFALADRPLDELRRHFRQFLIVESPDGAPWYFRFYDPRVLVKYLATSTAGQVADFFGPVRAFGMTDPATYGVTVLAPGDAPPAARPTPQPTLIRSRS